MEPPLTTEEFRNFDRLMRKLITVPKKVLDKRVAKFKKRNRQRKPSA
jgi:hypothetical protein